MKFSAALAFGIAVTGALAAPTSTEETPDHPVPPPSDLIWPSNTYRFWVHDGHAIQDPQDQLLVVRNGNVRDETTTIVTFDPKPEFAGRTCRLRIDLWNRDVSTGSQQADVFSWIGPLPNTLNVAKVDEIRPFSRGVQKGRITLPKPGQSQWIQQYDGYPEFPCPQELMAIEFVSAGQELALRWDIGATGPRIELV